MGHGLTWTDDEVDKLLDLVNDIKPHKSTSWVKVAEELGEISQKIRTGNSVRIKFLQMKRRYIMRAKEYPSGETELPPILKKVGKIVKALGNSVPPEDVDVLNPDSLEVKESVGVRSLVIDTEDRVVDIRTIDGTSETAVVNQRRQVDESVSHSVTRSHVVSKDQASCVSIRQVQHILGGINDVDTPSDSSDSMLCKDAMRVNQRKRAKISCTNGGTTFNEAVEADRMRKKNEKLRENSEWAIAREEAQIRHDEMMLRIEEMRAQKAEIELRLELARMKHNENQEKRRADEYEKRREERREERLREREERDEERLREREERDEERLREREERAERAKQFMLFMSKLFDSKN